MVDTFPGVNQQQVIFRTTPDNGQPSRLQLLRQPDRIVHDPPLQRPELLGLGQFEGHRHGGDGVHVRSPLFPREDGAVQLARQGPVVGHYQRPARPTQAFVRRRRDHVGDPDGTGMNPGSNQAGNV